VSVAAKISLFAALAAFGGVGIVYAPVLAYTAAAATFAMGLWSVTHTRRSSAMVAGAASDAEVRSKPRSALSTKLVSGFLLLWWLAVIAPIVAYSPRESVLRASEAAVGGSMRTQLLLVSFSLVGMLYLPEAIKRFDPAFRWVAVLWTLHLGWISASLLWSIYPPITLRNAVAFGLLSVGCFGWGAGFYGSRPNGRDLLLRHIFVAGVLSALAVLLPLPLRWGEYDLLDPTQRLSIGGGFPAYVIRPVLCALMVLIATAALQLRRWRRRDWFWVLVLVLPLLVLKSRGPVLFTLLALGIFFVFSRTRIQDRVWQIGLALVIGIGTYVYSSAGLFDVLVPYLTRGDVENTMALTGRVPLWEVMTSEIGQRPWLGSGFAAFWSPENYAWVEQVVGFHAVSAHNGYLDMLLSTGAIGLAILLTFCVYTMALGIRRARRGDPLGWIVFLLLTFYVLQNLTVSTFTEFFEITLILSLVVLGLMASRPLTAPPTSRKAVRSAPQRIASRY
jgi:exopolysaccharide production protein ExoQ